MQNLIWSANSTFGHLPAELQCLIFACLPLKDRIAITHVCHAWRKVALQAPMLWAQISWNGLKRAADIAVLHKRIARAGATRLDLNIQVPMRDSSIVFGVLRNHMHRVRALCLTIPNFAEGSEDLAQALGFLYTVPALELEYLHLKAAILLSNPFFRGITPKMTFLRTSGVRLSPEVSHPTITEAAFDVESLFIPSDITTIFGAFPSLKTLELTGKWCCNNGLQQSDLPLCSLPPQFYQLIISSDSSLYLTATAFAQIPLVSIAEVECRVESLYFTFDDTGAVFPPSKELMKTLLNTFAGQSDLHMSFKHTDGRSHINLVTQSTKRTFLLETPTVSPGLLMSLVSLHIKETDIVAWVTDHNVDTLGLPWLEILAIDLFDEDDWKRGRDHYSLFLLPPRQSGPFLHAPDLRLVQISCLEDNMCVSLNDFCDVLEHHLGRSQSNPLKYLEFFNVAFLDDRPVEIARMTLLARTIHFNPETLGWESHPSWDIDDIESEIGFRDPEVR